MDDLAALPRGGTGGGTRPDGTRLGLGGAAAVVLFDRPPLPLSTAGYCTAERLALLVAASMLLLGLLCNGGGLTGPAERLTGVDVAIGPAVEPLTILSLVPAASDFAPVCR